MIETFRYPDHLREVLSRRDGKWRFAVPVDPLGYCPKCRASVDELVARKFAVLLDRAPMNWREVYVYLLTPCGSALCRDEKIGVR
jgi:hypothetical protein